MYAIYYLFIYQFLERTCRFVSVVTVGTFVYFRFVSCFCFFAGMKTWITLVLYIMFCVFKTFLEKRKKENSGDKKKRIKKKSVPVNKLLQKMLLFLFCNINHTLLKYPLMSLWKPQYLHVFILPVWESICVLNPVKCEFVKLHLVQL